MDKLHRINTLQRFFSQDKIEQTFDLLLLEIQEDFDMTQMVIMQQSRFSQIEKEKNTVGQNPNYLMELNIIKKSLLGIIYELKDNLQNTFNPANDVIENKNDAYFIKGGFYALQKTVVELEKNTDKDKARYAVLGHIPSYMRRNPLTDKEAGQMFRHFRPAYLINDYVKLVNERFELFKDFLNKGGFIQEIYFKSDIENYVDGKNSPFDDAIDPISEVKERLSAMIEYNSKSNYYLYLLDKKVAIPKFVLKDKLGLVIDLRTVDTHTHLDNSYDGIFTKSHNVMTDFYSKFHKLVNDMNRNSNYSFLKNQLNHLNKKSR
jgi:hypothetical protein